MGEFGFGWPKFSSDDALNMLPVTPIIQNDLVYIFYKLDEHSACVEYIRKKAGKEDSEKQLCATPGLPSVHEPERRHGSSRVPEPLFVNLLRCPGIDSQRRAGRTTQFIVGADPPDYTGWRNRFLGSLNVYKYGLWPCLPCVTELMTDGCVHLLYTISWKFL